jgi:hypothetical protein
MALIPTANFVARIRCHVVGANTARLQSNAAVKTAQITGCGQPINRISNVWQFFASRGASWRSAKRQIAAVSRSLWVCSCSQFRARHLPIHSTGMAWAGPVARVRLRTPTAIASLELTYLNDYAPGGNQWISISDMAFVPEPNTFSLLWMGLIGLSIHRRRA